MGIKRIQLFSDCLDDESTLHRVEYDMSLAKSIGILGTPTFVTEKGVFPGEPGLDAAIASLSLDARQNSPSGLAHLSPTPLFVNPWTGELWTAGREGGGPGEFVGSGWGLCLFRQQQQLVVWDQNNNRRLTFFSDKGELLDARRVNAGWREDIGDRF